MNAVCRDIFKAIHERKWLSIEYRNKQDQLTKYRIGIRKINVLKRTLEVEGLHLGSCAVEKFQWIYIDSIQTSQIVEGSYCPINQELVNDIHLNPHKYKAVFDQVANLKILNYLEDCNRLDTTPYKSDFALIRYLDRESFHGDIYPLSDEQFKMIVKNFQMRAEKQPLVYVDVTDGQTSYKNTAPAEVEEIIRHGSLYKDKSIGVITPFVNQKDAIEKRLHQQSGEDDLYDLIQ